MTPKVTVCIPTYNSARYLNEAIDSILQQSLTDFQLVIIDDCSSDETFTIAREAASKDSRIELSRNSANIGMVPNWNRCLSAARGEYVRFLFGDDRLDSVHALEKMVELLDSDSTISLASSPRYLIDEQSAVTGVKSGFRPGSLLDGPEVIKRCLLSQKNLIGEPSIVMFRRLQAVRGFKYEYSQFVDMEMWFHLLEQGRFAFLGEPLSSFRVHEGQQTKKNVRELLHVDEMISLLDQFATEDEVGIGSVTACFLRYNQLYRFWKAYTTGKLDRKGAIARISKYMNPEKFRHLLPLYRVVSPLFKLRGACAERA